MLRVVIDTNLWIRVLLGGQVTLPSCRDPKDHPVLAAAIDGQADAIVTGDADLRADDELRTTMEQYGVALWGVASLLEQLRQE
jgi:predicted nucleic acid-binding protein